MTKSLYRVPTTIDLFKERVAHGNQSELVLDSPSLVFGRSKLDLIGGDNLGNLDTYLAANDRENVPEEGCRLLTSQGDCAKTH